MEPNERDTIFVLFVNSVSGSKYGKQYLTLDTENLTFKTGRSQTIKVFLFDLFVLEKRLKGLDCVKEHYRTSDVRIIVCGGDGSVLWVVQEVVDAGVDISRVTFGIVPIGTGNDFSRSLGWGSGSVMFSAANITDLRRLVMEWMHADVRMYDIWDLELELYPSGSICRIKDKKDSELQEKGMKKSFSNYFGVGIDARIGYSFDKYRTRSVFTNLLCYACIGLAKLFKRASKVEELVENMQYETVSEQINLVDSEQEGRREEKIGSSKKLVFHTNKDYYGEENHIKKGFRNIVCLNSTSFMGGANKIWTTKKSAIAQREPSQFGFTEQDFSDGMLEFVSFSSEFGLGLEKVVPGQSSKLTQGSGPFAINFKRAPNTEAGLVTYLQIDGEYFKVRDPKCIKVCKTTKIKGSQIKVMCKAT